MIIIITNQEQIMHKVQMANLNNLNNYQPNVIMGNKSKTKTNQSKNINKSNEKLKNISNNISNNNSKKTNGAPNNTNNSDNEKENNSLIQSTGNCLNTIAFSLPNNISNENSIQASNCIRFNGLNGNGFNPLSFSNNKKISNINDFTTFNSRISKK